jgi:hypothetical protein
MAAHNLALHALIITLGTAFKIDRANHTKSLGEETNAGFLAFSSQLLNSLNLKGFRPFSGSWFLAYFCLF